MKEINFLYLFILLIFASCSQGPEKTSVKISVAAITGSANFPGGLFLFGENTKDNVRISKRVPANDVLELELKNGDWSFALVGWDGSQFYEGRNYCDFSNGAVKLEGSNIDLNFEASSVKCALKWINGTNQNSVDFYSLNIHTCSGIREHLVIGDIIPSGLRCDGSSEVFNGGAKYFSVSMGEFDPVSGVNFSSRSRCLPVTNAEAISNVKLPFGSALLAPGIVVNSYKDANCTNLDKSYTFKSGLWKMGDNSEAVAVLDGTAQKINVYTHTDICNQGQKSNSPYAASAGTNHLICTPTQFFNISSNPTHSFELGSDIDMSGVSSIPDFSGVLEGNDKTLFNGNQPVFVTVSSGTNQVEIEDLNLRNFNLLDIGSPTDNAFGILAHSLVSSSNTIRIQNIEIDKTSSVELSSTSLGASTYLGGLAGLVNASSQIEIRDIRSFANVRAEDTFVKVGGLFGKVNGNGSSNNIRVEDSQVGSSSHRAIVFGRQNVGGLIGQLFDADISQGVKIYTSISGVTNIGGIVGDAQEGSYIRDTYVDTIFLPVTSLSATNVGGVIGSISGDKNVYLSGISSKFFVPSPGSSETITKLGGLIGGANGYTSANLSIDNSKSFVDFKINGSMHGGFIGEYKDSSFNEAADPSIIINSVVEGRIDSENDSSGNTRKGGLAGYFEAGRIENTIVNLELIQGFNKLGGAYGEGLSARLRESYISVGEIFATTTGINHLAQIIGLFDSPATPSGNFFESIISDVQLVTNNSISNCGISKCGKLYGELTGTNYNSHFKDIVSLGNIQREDGSVLADDAYMCGSSTNASTCISGTDNINASFILSMIPFASCSSLAVGLGFSLDTANNECTLAFERQWFKYSNSVDRGSNQYSAGNFLDPFVISTTSDWNEIIDDKLLMNKTFKLLNNLNFSGALFEPIGSDSNPFRGRIIPNHKTLVGINHTATTANSGVFAETQGATIGWYEDPLIIEGLDLNCGGNDNCSVIGFANETNLFAVVTDASITGSGNGLGGLVGSGDSRLSINESYFQGEVLGAGTGIGGLVGSFNGSLEVQSSAVYLDKITGFDDIGGFVGQFYSGGSGNTLNITDSYINFDDKGPHPGDNFNGSEGYQMGVLFGYVANGLTGEVKNVYMDTTKLAAIGNADVNSSYGVGSVSMNSTNLYMIDDTDTLPNQNGNIPTVVAKASDLPEDFRRGDNGSDWVEVGESLYLAWEANIFNLTN